MNTLNLTSEDQDSLEAHVLQIHGLIPSVTDRITQIRNEGQRAIEELSGEGRNYLGSGTDCIAFSLELPSGQIVAHKVSDDVEIVQNEIYGTSLALSMDIPTPEVIRSDEYSVTGTYISGLSLKHGDQNHQLPYSIFRNLGGYLAKLRNVKTIGFGKILGGQCKVKSVEDHINSLVHQLEALDPLILDASMKKTILRELRGPYPDYPTHLLHGDIFPHNWKINLGTSDIQGIFDWGDIKSGPSEFELMPLYICQHGEDAIPSIYDETKKGYEETTGETIDTDFVRQLALARFGKWLGNGRHLQKKLGILHSIIK